MGFGIYIHIPFCRKKCHYCDFYKTTLFNAKDDFIEALKQEIVRRKEEGRDLTAESIFFGGGTPSVLTVEEIESILNLLSAVYTVSPFAEVTMEVNPDDLTADYLRGLKAAGVNRLSIGVQSFRDSDLSSMNRRHNAAQALDAVKEAKNAGFSNISIDLIYGLPDQTTDAWEQNIMQAIRLRISHISAYHLTYHEGTVYNEYLRQGKIKELPEGLSLEQFCLLKSRLEAAGFEHYEISNFARDGMYSRHNRAYWERKRYIGFGPSAHSYDLRTRRWNVSNLARYLFAVKNRKSWWQSEVLRPHDQYNDYIITSLRTKWGISADFMKAAFDSRYVAYFEKQSRSYLKTGHLYMENGAYKLSSEGLFISDKIMESLFYMEE